jgi:hypothetical protein
MTLAAVAATTAVVGTAITASSQLAAGKAAQKAANFNASVNERNAQAREIQAENIARTTEFSIQRSREKFQRLNDRTQMAVRGNGWLATTGTPLKMLLQNAMNFEEDVAAQRLQSETKRLEQFEIATNQRLQGQLQRMQGKAAREISKTQAVGTLLSGGSQAYATYKMS